MEKKSGDGISKIEIKMADGPLGGEQNIRRRERGGTSDHHHYECGLYGHIQKCLLPPRLFLSSLLPAFTTYCAHRPLSFSSAFILFNLPLCLATSTTELHKRFLSHTYLILLHQLSLFFLFSPLTLPDFFLVLFLLLLLLLHFLFHLIVYLLLLLFLCTWQDSS